MSEVVFEGDYVYVNNIDADVPDAWGKEETLRAIKSFSITHNLWDFSLQKNAYKWVMPADVSYNSEERNNRL